MLEGLSFQFPKLAFLLFFFLACEALCPLRPHPIYFPVVSRFGTSETKPPLWIWTAKWAMITLLIVALMSPVREREPAPSSRYDLLIIMDPSIIAPKTIAAVSEVIEDRPLDRIAMWVPSQREVIVPLSPEHDALQSILKQLPPGTAEQRVSRQIERFFSTSSQGDPHVLILTDTPKRFVYSLPVGIETIVASPSDSNWSAQMSREWPPIRIEASRKEYEYLYFYPLFGGFMAMLGYLYGRNQKGVK